MPRRKRSRKTRTLRSSSSGVSLSRRRFPTEPTEDADPREPRPNGWRHPLAPPLNLPPSHHQIPNLLTQNNPAWVAQASGHAKRIFNLDRRLRMAVNYPVRVAKKASQKVIPTGRTCEDDVTPQETTATDGMPSGTSTKHLIPSSNHLLPRMLTRNKAKHRFREDRHNTRGSSRNSTERTPTMSSWGVGTAASAGAMVHRDEVTFFVGRHGPFQVMTFHFGLIAAFVLPFYTMHQQLVAPDVDHWCARPDHLRSNISVEQWKRQMIPRTPDDKYSRCTMYSVWNGTGVTTVPCTSWEYENTNKGNSIVQDFDLVCDRAWFFPMSASFFAVGAICALLVSGPMADWVGRKPVIQSSVVLLQVAVLVIIFSRLFSTYLAMRFFLGAATTTLFTTSFVLVIEVMAPDNRILYGMAVMMGHAMGSLTTSCLGWLNFGWHDVQYLGMLPALMLLRVFTSVNESPRWLIATGKTESAEAVIMHAARLNGENLLQLKRLWTRKRREIERAEENKPSGPTCWDMLSLRGHERNTIMLYYCWTVTSVTYHVATLKVQYLGFTPEVLLTLATALEIPADLSAIVSSARLGRRTCHAVALLCGSLACFLAFYLGDGNVVPSLAAVIVVRVGIGASYTIITMYTAEVYPTVIRCTGVAFCYCFFEMGTFTASLAANLMGFQKQWTWLVMVALLCIWGALLALLLPETLDRKLTDKTGDTEY